MSKQGDNVSESALNALKKYFRHQSFKSDLQRKAVEAVIKGIFNHKFTVKRLFLGHSLGVVMI